jgi:hypothetical protein
MMAEYIDVKIIRLVTGEDVVGLCLYDDDKDYIDIENPMKVILKRMTDSEQTALILLPWLPYEIVEDNSVRISNNDIITFITPKASFIDYYIALMDKFEKSALEEEEDDIFFPEEVSAFGMEDIEDELIDIKEDTKKVLH